MSDDWNTMVTRDWETLPRYTATGLERGIMANRVSYFFDWHGPSMTLDTACSSSLVALDLAVQIVRSGKSNVAVAAGTNLILSPGEYCTIPIQPTIDWSCQQCTSPKVTLVCFPPTAVVLCGIPQPMDMLVARAWLPSS